MPINLTANAIPSITGGDLNLRALVQILDIKLIGQSQDRYRILIFDSVSTQQAMLATQLNDRLKTGVVRKGSVVQLIEYICNTVQNRKIIVVLNMETIVPEERVDPSSEGKYMLDLISGTFRQITGVL